MIIEVIIDLNTKTLTIKYHNITLIAFIPS
jgi:hypothetical protein